MKYEKALVIGKFMDTHVGHIALHKYAKSLAKSLMVLVCSTKDDRVDPEIRATIIRNTFGTDVEVEVFYYAEAGLEGGEVSDVGISKRWAEWVDRELPDVDVLVGSEDYITYMAEEGNFDGVIYDQARTINNCSSTAVNAGDYESYCTEAKALRARNIYIVGDNDDYIDNTMSFLTRRYDVEHLGSSRRIFGYENHNDTVQDMEVSALQRETFKRVLGYRAKQPICLIHGSTKADYIKFIHKFNKTNLVINGLADHEEGTYIVLPDVHGSVWDRNVLLDKLGDNVHVLEEGSVQAQIEALVISGELGIDYFKDRL